MSIDMGIITFRDRVKDVMKRHIIYRVPFDQLFDGYIDFNHFIDQILFEKFKGTYSENSKKRSLRSHIQTEQTFDADYQKMKRIVSFSNYYKDINIQDFLKQGIDINEISGLETHKTEGIVEKLQGLFLSELDFLQLDTMDRVDLLKSITSKRITSSKKTANSRFIEMFNQLDSYYLDVKVRITDDNYFLHLFNLYYIELNYFTELVYWIATFVDEQNLSEDSIPNIEILFSVKDPNINFQAENRFMMKRHLYIPDLVNDNKVVYNQLAEILYQKAVLLSHHFRDELDAVYKQIDATVVASHLKSNYKLFDMRIEDKNWNGNKIKIARAIYDKFLDNIKLPKIRT